MKEKLKENMKGVLTVIICCSVITLIVTILLVLIFQFLGHLQRVSNPMQTHFLAPIDHTQIDTNKRSFICICECEIIYEIIIQKEN